MLNALPLVCAIRDFLPCRPVTLVLVIILSIIATNCPAESPDNRLPNIVLILADDMGYGDPHCYNDQSKIPTPNIDQLAMSGLRLTDAHTPSSVCTPTRYGLLTGRFCWRSPLKQGVLWVWDPPLIEDDRLTLPKMLKEVGYDTACIGKWHLGWDWPLENGSFLTDEFAGHLLSAQQRAEYEKRIDFSRATRGGPTARGFDSYFGDDVPNFPPYCFISNDRTVGIPSVLKPDDMFGNPGPALPGWDLSVVLPTLAQHAVQYIQQRGQTGQRPFFLYLPLTAPHTPIAPSPHFIGSSQAGWYGDYVCEVDWVVGQVRGELERNGLLQNTLIIFTSDNGSPQRDGEKMDGSVGAVKIKYGHDPSRPWRGLKADIWEGGHRVPFIASWPEGISPQRVSDEPIILTDVMRTVATLVGYALPEHAAEDSLDIGPVLWGTPSGEPIHKYLIHHAGHGMFAIREGNWKLILGRGSGGFTAYTPPDDAPDGQLYNLADDPQEQRNVYRQHPEIVARLTALLTECRNDH